MRFFISALTLLASGLISNAGAAELGQSVASIASLAQVDFTGSDEAMEFSFGADAELKAEQLYAKAEGPVLVFVLKEVHTKRRWMDWKDRSIKKTLVKPHARHKDWTVLRVRTTRKISKTALRNVRVRVEGGKVIAAVPRTMKIAKAWAAGRVAARPEPTAAPTPVVEARPEPVEEAFVAFGPPAPNLWPQSPAGLGSEAEIPLSEPLGADEQMPIESAVGSPKGPGAGAVAVSMLFLMAVGFFLWRKSRGGSMPGASGQLIKPIGAHMLGPKQGLLLVDVAGQMVLLGTGDKGVQMLTTIEALPEISDDEPMSFGEAEAPAVPVVPFADRLGQAIAKVREATRKPSMDEAIFTEPAERAFLDREEEALREAAEDDAIAALAERVEDKAPSLSRRPQRPKRDPIVTGPLPRGLSVAGPSARQTFGDGSEAAADLLARIRRLQSA